MASLEKRVSDLEKSARSTKETVFEHFLKEISGTSRGLPSERGETLTICQSQEPMSKEDFDAFMEWGEWAARTPLTDDLETQK